jgi:hypothetical protein
MTSVKTDESIEIDKNQSEFGNKKINVNAVYQSENFHVKNAYIFIKETEENIKYIYDLESVSKNKSIMKNIIQF